MPGTRLPPCDMIMSRHVWGVRARVAEGLALARHTAASSHRRRERQHGPAAVPKGGRPQAELRHLGCGEQRRQRGVAVVQQPLAQHLDSARRVHVVVAAGRRGALIRW